jgi:CYTH domain-containing protein
MEIERKFLVRQEALPELGNGTAIVQGYLAIEADGNEVRIRRKGDAYFLTVKSGDTGMTRAEAECSIAERMFQELWPLAAARSVEKTRHELTLSDGLVAELDVFSGNNAGLLLVEVEFADEQSALGFTPPAWFGEDVTDQSKYKNKNLALKKG